MLLMRIRREKKRGGVRIFMDTVSAVEMISGPEVFFRVDWGGGGKLAVIECTLFARRWKSV